MALRWIKNWPATVCRYCDKWSQVKWAGIKAHLTNTNVATVCPLWEVLLYPLSIWEMSSRDREAAATLPHATQHDESVSHPVFVIVRSCLHEAEKRDRSVWAANPQDSYRGNTSVHPFEKYLQIYLFYISSPSCKCNGFLTNWLRCYAKISAAS